MKKYLIAAGFAMMIAAQVSAQGPAMDKKTPEERATAQSKMLAKKLSLTAEQQKKVYDIDYNRAKKMEELQTSTTDRQAKMQQRRALMEDSDKQIETVLNDKQKKDYAAWKAEAKERKGHMRHGDRPMKRDSSAKN